MAGFGAGFAKAISGSLEAAGKLHQEEQLRTREYERAKADRQAERLESRAWEQEDAATRRSQELEDEARKQRIDDEKDPLRTFYDESQKKWFFRTRSGELVEQPSDSPLVESRKRFDTKYKEERDSHSLNMEATRANIRQSNAAAAASNARAKADSEKLPDDLYAKVQFDLKPVSAQYDNIDKITQGIIGSLRQANSDPKLDPKTRAKNNALLKEALGLRHSLIGSQQALSAEYVNSGYTLNPSELITPKLNELRAKFPNAWGRFDSVNKANNAQAAEAKKAADAKAVQMPKQ